MEQVKKKGHRTKFIQFNSDGELLCYICKNYKDTPLFDDNLTNTHRDCKDRRCKSCKHDAYERRRASTRGQKDLRRILVERIAAAKDRVKKSGFEMKITLEDLQDLWDLQDGKCAISGIQMTYIFNNGRTPTNVSLDRINPLEGYTKENIQLVCMATNQMKSDLSMDELLYFCEQISKNARKWH